MALRCESAVALGKPLLVISGGPLPRPQSDAGHWQGSAATPGRPQQLASEVALQLLEACCSWQTWSQDVLHQDLLPTPSPHTCSTDLVPRHAR